MRIDHHGKAFEIIPGEGRSSPPEERATAQLAAWVQSLDLGETYAMHSQLLAYQALQSQIIAGQEENAHPEIPKWVERAFAAIDEACGPHSELDLIAV